MRSLSASLVFAALAAVSACTVSTTSTPSNPTLGVALPLPVASATPVAEATSAGVLIPTPSQATLAPTAAPTATPTPTPTAMPTTTATVTPVTTATATPVTAPTATPTPAPTATPTPTPTATPKTAGVSFLKDVSPLLVSRCASCHGGPGGTAGIVVTGSNGSPDYADVSAEISSIIPAVQSGRMPRSGPPLTTQEIATLQAWAAAGSPNN